MIYTEEQIFIVLGYEKPNDRSHQIALVREAVNSFKLKSSFVKSVAARTIVFDIPAGSNAGSTLNSELIRALQKSIGAIVFVDLLKPNVAYELGFFHGQGKPVLFITDGKRMDMSISMSDLAGVSMLDIADHNLEAGIHMYLNDLYNTLARIPAFQLPELPVSSRNELRYLVENKGAKNFLPELYEGEFGTSMTVNTWGGLIIRTNTRILADAKFKILLRTDNEADYSIYFRIRYIDTGGESKKMYLGVTSSRSITGFESNERNLPGQPLTSNWSMLCLSFKQLLAAGQILGDNRPYFLEIIRFRAAFDIQDQKEVASYEVGYLEIIGQDG